MSTCSWTGRTTGLGADLGTPPVPDVELAAGGRVRDRQLAVRGLQSSVSDCIFYDSTRTLSQIAENYYAGAFGSLAGAVLTSGEAINQTLGMIRWLGDVDPVGEKIVAPGDMKGRSALDLIDQFSSAEQSPFYQAPDGSLQLDRGWPTTWTGRRLSS